MLVDVWPDYTTNADPISSARAAVEAPIVDAINSSLSPASKIVLQKVVDLADMSHNYTMMNQWAAGHALAVVALWRACNICVKISFCATATTRLVARSATRDLGRARRFAAGDCICCTRPQNSWRSSCRECRKKTSRLVLAARAFSLLLLCFLNCRRRVFFVSTFCPMASR